MCRKILCASLQNFTLPHSTGENKSAHAILTNLHWYQLTKARWICSTPTPIIFAYSLLTIAVVVIATCGIPLSFAIKVAFAFIVETIRASIIDVLLFICECWTLYPFETKETYLELILRLTNVKSHVIPAFNGGTYYLVTHLRFARVL